MPFEDRYKSTSTGNLETGENCFEYNHNFQKGSSLIRIIGDFFKINDSREEISDRIHRD